MASYKVEFWRADAQDLAAIEQAAAEYRSFWSSFPSMPFPAPFNGGIEDIDALDYLDYEGLGGPPGGIEAAALTWGQVLAHQTGLQWVRCSIGGLWLRAEDPACGAVSLWPLARVAEIQSRSSPQFDKFEVLTERVLRECLEGFILDGEVSERMERFLAKIKSA
jgi:hypothetical protein